MNQTFNLKRFSMLFKKHSIENYRTYLMSTAVLAGMLLLFFGFISYGNDGHLPQVIQAGGFAAYLSIAGCIFTSLIFADLGNKKEAIPALTLPASHFEKYLVNWVYSFIIFQLIFIAVFYLIVSVVIQFGNPSTPDRGDSLLNLFSADQKAYYAFIIYTVLHAVTFFGAIYFEKLHFVKTIFALFIGAFILGLINKPIMRSMIKETINGTIFSPVIFTDGKHIWTIHAVSMPDYLGVIALALVVLVLWISAYYKLKEKEV